MDQLVAEDRRHLDLLPEGAPERRRRENDPRKRQPGGDSAAQYFNRTECVAGVQDMRLQELMPDVFHWLGVARIDRFASMSNMKSDALREQGIEIVEQVAIPDELIPADAQVEMDAKKAAGYFSATKPGSNELARPKGRNLDE